MFVSMRVFASLYVSTWQRQRGGGGQTDRQTDRQRQIRQTDRQTDRDTDRRKERDTDRMRECGERARMYHFYSITALGVKRHMVP